MQNNYNIGEQVELRNGGLVYIDSVNFYMTHFVYGVLKDDLQSPNFIQEYQIKGLASDRVTCGFTFKN